MNYWFANADAWTHVKIVAIALVWAALLFLAMSNMAPT